MMDASQGEQNALPSKQESKGVNLDSGADYPHEGTMPGVNGQTCYAKSQRVQGGVYVKPNFPERTTV